MTAHFTMKLRFKLTCKKKFSTDLVFSVSVIASPTNKIRKRLLASYRKLPTRHRADKHFLLSSTIFGRFYICIGEVLFSSLPAAHQAPCYTAQIRPWVCLSATCMHCPEEKSTWQTPGSHLNKLSPGASLTWLLPAPTLGRPSLPEAISPKM